ncbi:unnamed protein product [Vicia faba]|uniref:Uncharacterized protein n=1 Tax=Vicia faba TaxID=3906 RepID=A0AAV1BEC0_VICFA|nr:unnamed protein product [Vicia faba]
MAFQLLCENHSSLSLAACDGRFTTRLSTLINKHSSATNTITSCPSYFFFRFTSLNLDYLQYLLLRLRSVSSRRGFIPLSSQHRPLIQFQRDEDDESKGVMQMKMMNDEEERMQFEDDDERLAGVNGKDVRCERNEEL